MGERNDSVTDAQERDFILQEQTRLLLQQSTTAVAVNLSIAFLTFLSIPSKQHFWLWMIVGASGLRLIFYFWYRKNLSQSLKIKTIYLILLVLIILQGAAWGYTSIRLFISAPDLHKFYLMAIICGMSGGSILTLSSSFLAFACFTLPAVSPLVLVLLMESDEAFRYPGYMGIVFIIAVHVLARRIYNSSLELLQSNRCLELTSRELAQHKDRLEVLVEARTKDLMDSRERYRQLTEEINDVIFELDSTGRVTYISPVITLLLGYTSNKLNGVLFTDLVFPEDRPIVQALMPEIITEELKPADYRIIDSAGKPHWVRTSIRPIAGGNRPICFRGVLADIEGEKRAEAEKKILLERFYENQKFEAIGTLAAGIAHDFNNLLMGIQGRASLMAMRFEASDPNLEHTQAIEEHVRSATNLTGQLLGIAHGGKYDPKPTDLNALVVRNATMFNRTRKEIQLHTNMSPAPVVAEVDRQQIEQVLLNLYVNSWQAMPDGGEMYLESSIAILSDSEAELYHVLPGRYAKISVTDSGIGMDDSTRLRIFDPFFTTKDKGRGTGLGLSSAYGIINNHDGFITVESELGKGTTVIIYLPVTDKDPYQLPSKESETIRGSETILLVDDEELILDVGEALLKELGYKAIVAKSGEEAVEYMKNRGKEIDLVILDMVMPKMDGGMTFDKIRQLQPAVPIILASGYSLNGQATQIMQKGCQGFLQKPFGLSELSQKIRSTLDGNGILRDG